MSVLSYVNAFPGMPMPQHNPIQGASITAPTAATVTDQFGNVWSFGASLGGGLYQVLENSVNVAGGGGTVIQLVSGFIWVLGVSATWFLFNYSTSSYQAEAGLPVTTGTIVQNYLFPGALQPIVSGPAVLSYTNAFPGIPVPQHLSGQTSVQSFLYPGALQPLQVTFMVFQQITQINFTGSVIASTRLTVHNP